MTRTKNETVEEPTNPDQEPEEVIEGDDTDLEPEEEKPSAPEPEDPASYTLERQWKLENERHIEAVKGFMGDEFESLVCPKCDGSGFTDIPLTLLDVYVADETKAQCPKCKGKGQLATPSLVEGQETVVCITCSGVGWITRQAEPANVVQFAPQTPTQTAPPPSMTYGYVDANGEFHAWAPTGNP